MYSDLKLEHYEKSLVVRVSKLANLTQRLETNLTFSIVLISNLNTQGYPAFDRGFLLLLVKTEIILQDNPDFVTGFHDTHLQKDSGYFVKLKSCATLHKS